MNDENIQSTKLVQIVNKLDKALLSRFEQQPSSRAVQHKVESLRVENQQRSTTKKVDSMRLSQFDDQDTKLVPIIVNKLDKSLLSRFELNRRTAAEAK